MPKMTVSVPNELLSQLRKKHPEINWAEIVRSGIIHQLEKLEKLHARGAI